ncbi:toxin HipA [Anoxybacillus ayderensis G10]|nr:toxin HipA [Anoxybacillus ayderensis G10]
MRFVNILDVSHWRRDDKRQASGTRQKFWLVSPYNEKRYLFKIPKENTGEAWAEVVASKLGELIRINTMKAHLATYNGLTGCLLENFVVANSEFYEGGDLFFTIAEDFDRYNLNYYDFLNIIKVLSPFELDRAFVQIPVFDAFIANQDRHCDNWGVIVEGAGYRLAPVYDNGASLGYQLNEERIIKMFQDQKMFEAFTNRSHSLIGLPSKKKPKYKELLSFIYGLYPKEIQEIIERISNVDERTIAIVLNEIPDSCMNAIYKRWVSKLLLHRKQWLIKWYMEVKG